MNVQVEEQMCEIKSILPRQSFPEPRCVEIPNCHLTGSFLSTAVAFQSCKLFAQAAKFFGSCVYFEVMFICTVFFNCPQNELLAIGARGFL